MMWSVAFYLVRVFFFQAEDGIRDVAVTGVQTCALPICLRQWSTGGLRCDNRAVAAQPKQEASPHRFLPAFLSHTPDQTWPHLARKRLRIGNDRSQRRSLHRPCPYL